MKQSLTEKQIGKVFNPFRDRQLPDCHSLNDWGEMEDCLVKRYHLEDAVISLHTDPENATGIERFEEMDFEVVSEEIVVLSLVMGSGVKLKVSLARGPEGDASVTWPPRADFEPILSCAKEIFSRVVRDRVVDLMLRKGDAMVVSFFLDEEGHVESASGQANHFCESFFEIGEHEKRYFPDGFLRYLKGAIKKQRFLASHALSESSLVFSYLHKSHVLNCLLQRMGSSGSLLSLSLEE